MVECTTIIQKAIIPDQSWLHSWSCKIMIIIIIKSSSLSSSSPSAAAAAAAAAANTYFIN